MTTLLTLHADRLDRVPAYPAADGLDLAGHYLFAAACDLNVITWDESVWGKILSRFGIRPVRVEWTDRVHELEIDYQPYDLGPWVAGAVHGELPDDFDELTDEEQADLPSSIPDPTRRPLEYLTLVVDAFNALHADTERMIANWPTRNGPNTNATK